MRLSVITLRGIEFWVLRGGSGNWDGNGAGCVCHTSHGTRLAPAAGSLGTLLPGTPHVGSGSMLLWHGRVFARALLGRCGARSRTGVQVPTCARQERIRAPSSLRAFSAGHITNRQNERGDALCRRARNAPREDRCRARTDTSYRLVRTHYTNAAL